MIETNGKEVESIWWIDGNEGGALFSAKDGITMHVENKYHGDHDEDWVVAMENGVELSRHNTRHIASIVWKKP